VARRDPSAIGGRRRVKKRQAGGGAEEEEEEWGCGAADGGMIELERKSGGESGGGRDLARSLSHPRRVAWLAFFIQHRQADTGCSRSAPNTPPPPYWAFAFSSAAGRARVLPAELGFTSPLKRKSLCIFL